MTWSAWLALGAALALVGAPSVPAVRSARLAGHGRLAGRPVAASRAMSAMRALPWPAGAGVLGALAVLAVYSRLGWSLAVAVAALLGTGAALVRDVGGGRASTARHRDLLTALRVLVGELEVGTGLPASLAAAATAGPRVAAVLRSAATAAAQGGDAGAVLEAADGRDLQVIGVAWRLGETTGAALAGVLGRVAADLASADDQRRTVATALAGPRSSATLLAGLPVLGVALGTAMGARPVHFLISDSAGRVVCCIGVLLDVGGVWWMRRILRRAERA